MNPMAILVVAKGSVLGILMCTQSACLHCLTLGSKTTILAKRLCPSNQFPDESVVNQLVTQRRVKEFNLPGNRVPPEMLPRCRTTEEQELTLALSTVKNAVDSYIEALSRQSSYRF